MSSTENKRGRKALNNYQRPLRIRLRKDDVIYYQHIQRAGGASLITLLEAQFPTSAVFPMHPATDKFPVETLALDTKKHLFRLVRGHLRYGPYDEGIYHHLARNPLWITTVREPVARTLSAYHHLRRNNRIPQDLSMMDWLRDPDWKDRVTNHQATWLAGEILPADGTLSALNRDVLLHLAKENLEYMAWFGVLDRYRESIQLLCYTFGWELPDATPHLNASPSPLSRESLAPEELALIEEMTAVDKALYEFALTLFDARYTQMKTELGAQPTATTQEIDTLLAANYKRRILQKTTAGGSLPLRSALPYDWGKPSAPPKGVRKRAIYIVRRAAPDGTWRGQLYLWARDAVQRAPVLAQLFTGKKPKA